MNLKREVAMSDICGLPIVGMPDEVTPLAALVIVKALDEDGDVAYYARATEGVTSVEAIGMANYARIRLERGLDDDQWW